MLEVSRSVMKRPLRCASHQRGIAEQVEQRIGRALDLEQFGVGDRAERADDGVARAGHDRGIGIGRTQARAAVRG